MWRSLYNNLNKQLFRKLVNVMNKILALLCLSFTLYTGMNMVFADEPVYYNQKVTVHSGDTMWSIAHRWSDDKEDVREVMHRICEANNLKSKHIYPGQVLTIPVKAVTQNDFMLAGK